MKLRPSLSSLRYDLFELADPTKDMFEQAWNTLEGHCSGGQSLVGVDYHHVSSISVGPFDNLLVTSRELNTVWSLAHNGSGVQWSLSSSLESASGPRVEFERDAMAFYSPHDVKQMPNGDLLVIDDGATRPGCYDQVAANCFSRAAMYAIDLDANRARVVWQFSHPTALSGDDPNNWAAVMGGDTYNACGGSVEKLPNGNYLVAFTGMSADSQGEHDWDTTRTAFAWEIDADGAARSDDGAAPSIKSLLKIPLPHWNVGNQNGYRVVPWHSIHGESTSEPW